MGVVKLLGGAGVLVAAIIAGVSLTAPRNVIPDHMINKNLVDLDNFFTEGEVDEMLAATRARKVIPPMAREYDSYTPDHDNIGEAVPYNVSAGCPKFLIPNAKKTHCVFPGRIDVGRHFIQSGGPGGIKQRFATMVTRLYGFITYDYDVDGNALAKKLFKQKKFQDLAKSVCPAGRNKILDPIQMNHVVQLPGQTVATHVDAVYFQRMSRFHWPQWVQAVMQFSGLFQDDFIPQVQVVGYYHKWQDPNSERSGNFKFWNSKDIEPTTSRPTSRSANAVDGSIVVHAADVYMPDELPPKLPIDAVNELIFNDKTKEWDLTTDGKVVKSYDEKWLRFSIVYRARCFEDEKQKKQYHEDQKKPMDLETEVWSVFRKDLIKRGLLKEGQELSPYEWGLLLLDTYVKYPLSPSAIIPYNYCALDRVYPWLAPVLPWIGCK